MDAAVHLMTSSSSALAFSPALSYSSDTNDREYDFSLICFLANLKGISASVNQFALYSLAVFLKPAPGIQPGTYFTGKKYC